MINNNFNKEGLTDKEVLESREQYGTNAITAVKKEIFLKQYINSLGDPIIKILLIALGIKLVFLMKDFDWYETVGIVIAIFLASFISTMSEYGSEKAFEKLQEESSKVKCRIKRNKKIIEVNIDEVVKNDIVILQTGDKIPADGVIIKGDITVDESSINGETKEIKKTSPLSFKNIEEKNIVFRGTIVYNGEAEMLVTNVGDKTFYGKLASELQDKGPESPLKLKLRHLAGIISKLGYIGAFLVSVSYLFSNIILKNNFDINLIKETITNAPIMIGHVLYALTLCVTVIVVAVPEGLPMMITLVLSSNMKKMLKNNILVRKLVGIETAGSINILFTDKTGTLTKGKLEVIEIKDATLKSFKTEKTIMNYPKFHELIKLSLTANNASTYTEKKEIIGGNITDKALLKFIKSDITKTTKLTSIPFNSKDKYSLSTVKHKNQNLSLIKGAPEKLLPNCRTYYDIKGEKRSLLTKKNILNEIDDATKKSIRVILLAINTENNLNNLTLLGLVYIKDDVRKEAKESINLVQNAHIQTVMITGDNKETALSVAREVGLITKDSDITLTSSELNEKTDEEIKEILPNIKVVARSLPQDKSRLVRISQELGLVVGMTGDGVNDAPALKKADVGFAMGSGTEVSKEASDIVILDDNFLSITKAILFGRTIFKSIRKFIIFQLTVNLCAVSLSILGPFIGVETPVTVIQMLWINMVMDTLAGLAFAFEPPLKEYMYEKPKKRNTPIINKYMKDEIIFTGIYSSILCILFLKLPFIHSMFRFGEQDQYLLTAFFGLFIFISIFNSFNARTHRLNLLSNLKKNKVFIIIILTILIIQVLLIYHGGNLFRTAGLTKIEFLTMFLLSATVIPVDWLRKAYLRTKGNIGGV